MHGGPSTCKIISKGSAKWKRLKTSGLLYIAVASYVAYRLVCSVCWLSYSKSYKHIWIKFCGGGDHGQRRNCFNSGCNPVFGGFWITIEDSLPLGNKMHTDALQHISASYEQTLMKFYRRVESGSLTNLAMTSTTKMMLICYFHNQLPRQDWKSLFTREW